VTFESVLQNSNKDMHDFLFLFLIASGLDDFVFLFSSFLFSPLRQRKQASLSGLNDQSDGDGIHHLPVNHLSLLICLPFGAN